MKNKTIFCMPSKPSNAKIILTSTAKANLNHVDIIGVDIENNGQTDMKNTTLRDNSFTNTQTGKTKVGGDLEGYGSHILNEGHLTVARDIKLYPSSHPYTRDIRSKIQKMVDTARNHWIVVMITLIFAFIGAIAGLTQIKDFLSKSS